MNNTILSLKQAKKSSKRIQKRKEYEKRYRKANHEKVLLWKRNYRQKHKKEILEKALKYQREHPEFVRARFLRYKQRHPAKMKAYDICRRARKMKAKGYFTFHEWLELKKKHDYTCVACYRKEPEIKLTADHIIPLAKGGSNWISNIQPLCASCNSKKHTRILSLEQLRAIIRG